jgi:hypothetical protein
MTEESYKPKHGRTLPTSSDQTALTASPSLARRGLRSLKDQIVGAVFGAFIGSIFVGKFILNAIHWVKGRPSHIPNFTVSEFRHPTFWPEIFLTTVLLLWEDFFLGMGAFQFHFRRRADLPRTFWFNIITKSIICFLVISGLSRPVMPTAVSLGSLIILWLILRKNLALIMFEVIAFIGASLRVTPERQELYERCFDANVETY